MKSASLSAGLLVSKGAATPSLPREILDPANYADLDNVRLPPSVRPKVMAPAKVLAKAKGEPKAKQASTRANDNSPRISTTVRLSGDAHKRLRLLAARDRVNLQVLLQQATAELLNRELGEDDCVCSGDN